MCLSNMDTAKIFLENQEEDLMIRFGTLLSSHVHLEHYCSNEFLVKKEKKNALGLLEKPNSGLDH